MQARAIVRGCVAVMQLHAAPVHPHHPVSSAPWQHAPQRAKSERERHKKRPSCVCVTRKDCGVSEIWSDYFLQRGKGLGGMQMLRALSQSMVGPRQVWLNHCEDPTCTLHACPTHIPGTDEPSITTGKPGENKRVREPVTLVLQHSTPPCPLHTNPAP
eukprot:3103246-Rhodomonas_salina.1